VREPPGDPAELVFSELFRAHSRSLLAYALRRVERPHDAADVVAETMLVAWRRLPEVPEGHEARLWLFGVARRVLLNHHRSERRSLRLGERLKACLSEVAIGDPADLVGESAVMLAAMARLGDDDRELLRLTAWEGLEPAEIAVAMSMPAATVRTRLHRARARLWRHLEEEGWRGERSAPSGHEPCGGHVLARRVEGEA
jgi:RNA polymerase sigma factor (sigma-70 family)